MTELIAYLGPAGTFTEEVTMKYSSGCPLLLKPLPSLEKVMDAVDNGDAKLGVVPVENSSEGSVNLTFDLLARGRRAKIRGELLHRVQHSLLVRPGQAPEGIVQICSHPQALAQCRGFLEKNYAKTVIHSMASTAEAAALVAQSEGKAALASGRAAQLYGLQILEENVQDESNNITRFLLLALQDAPPTGEDKTSLLLGLNDRPGSLYSVLGIFADKDINLTKIESRPIRSDLGKYIFFLDIEGHRNDPVVERALEELDKRALFLKVLGSYPKGKLLS